jgi:hypothetical protein
MAASTGSDIASVGIVDSPITAGTGASVRLRPAAAVRDRRGRELGHDGRALLADCGERALGREIEHDPELPFVGGDADARHAGIRDREASLASPARVRAAHIDHDPGRRGQLEVLDRLRRTGERDHEPASGVGRLHAHVAYGERLVRGRDVAGRRGRSPRIRGRLLAERLRAGARRRRQRHAAGEHRRRDSTSDGLHRFPLSSAASSITTTDVWRSP